MRFEKLSLDGACLIHPTRHADSRGHFSRLFCEDTLRDAGLEAAFPQWSLSHNTAAHTLRGMHFQIAPHEEVKIVSAVRGAIYDVIVDVRAESATRGQWFGVELSAENGLALYIPKGFAHGFVTLADDTDVLYAISERYAPGFGRGYRYDDPAFAIAWPAAPGAISDQDRGWPPFAK